jgi:hypothetical protein
MGFFLGLILGLVVGVLFAKEVKLQLRNLVDSIKTKLGK